MGRVKQHRDVASQRGVREVLEAGPADPRYPIWSVDKALRLLHMVAERQRLTVSKASAELEVAPSTAHRLLGMLRYREFVDQDPVTKEYVPGRALADLATLTFRGTDFKVEAHRFLERLVAEFDETAHLTTLRGRDVLFLSVVESSQVLRMGSRVGHLLPAHCTASGKALLARLAEEDLAALFVDEKLPGLRPSSIVSRSKLFEELAEVRERGYATNKAESEADVAGAAAAFSDPRGVPVGALVVSGPQSRLPDERLARIGEETANAARMIEKLLP